MQQLFSLISVFQISQEQVYFITYVLYFPHTFTAPASNHQEQWTTSLLLSPTLWCSSWHKPACWLLILCWQSLGEHSSARWAAEGCAASLGHATALCCFFCLVLGCRSAHTTGGFLILGQVLPRIHHDFFIIIIFSVSEDSKIFYCGPKYTVLTHVTIYVGTSLAYVQKRTFCTCI